MVRLWLFLAFVAVPIVEIALFIQVGGLIGLWPTLAIIVLTAFAGTALMRVQGLQTLRELGAALERGGNPVGHIAHGALILIAGVLLLTPGFFTDTLGLVLLVPAIRARLIRWAGKRVIVETATAARPRQRASGGSEPIEVDYEVLDEPSAGGPRDSGWTRPRR